MADRRPDPELVAEVVLRLLQVRRRLGPATFQEAADRALVGIGVAAHREAERRARKPRKVQMPAAEAPSVVVQFPLARAVSPQAAEDS